MNEGGTMGRDLVEEIKWTDRDSLELPGPYNLDSLGALRIKLCYVFLTKRHDLWEECQRKIADMVEDETVHIPLRLLASFGPKYESRIRQNVPGRLFEPTGRFVLLQCLL